MRRGRPGALIYQQFLADTRRGRRNAHVLVSRWAPSGQDHRAPPTTITASDALHGDHHQPGARPNTTPSALKVRFWALTRAGECPGSDIVGRAHAWGRRRVSLRGGRCGVTA